MNAIPEEVKAEETTEAVLETESAVGRQLFAYDKDYAKKKKTYTMAVWKGVSIVLTLAVDALAIVGAVMVLPEDSPLIMVILGVGLLAALFALFVMPSFFNYKIKAPFKSFLTDDDKLWALEFTPYTANSKQAGAAGINKVFCEECFKVCKSKEAVAEIVEKAKNNENLNKGKSYKKVKVVCMNNPKMVKSGKNAKVSYTDKKGRTKNTKIADCYPGLFEYIG